MGLDKLKKLMLVSKNSNAFSILDDVDRLEDFVYINPDVADAINKKQLIHEDDFRGMHDDTEEYLIKDKKTVLLNQKYFMIARALIVSENPTFNHIFDTFSNVEIDEDAIKDEMKNICLAKAKDLGKTDEYLQDYIDEYTGKIPDAFLKQAGSQDAKKQLEIDAKAVLMAQEMKDNKHFIGRFNNNLIVKLIDEAIKKDKKFMENSFNEYAVARIDYDNMEYIAAEIDKVDDNEINELKNYASISTARILKEKIDENNLREETLEAKEGVRQLVNERNNKSMWWKIFRPFSNLANYLQVKHAKENYIKTYIDPNYATKNDPSYIEALEKFERAVNSENEIKFQVKPTSRVILNNRRLQNEEFNKELGDKTGEKVLNVEKNKVLDNGSVENKIDDLSKK